MGLDLGKIAGNFFNPVNNFLNPLLGVGGGGGLLGGGGLNFGPSPAGTTTTVNDIPAWQRPYVQRAMDSATGALDRYSWGPQIQPMLESSQDQYMKTLRGDYLNSNPYLDATFNSAARNVSDVYKNTVQPRTDSMFFGPGSMGGNTAYQGQVARNNYGFGQNLTDLATNIYGGNYQQERNRQFAATGSAPQYLSGATQAIFSPYTNYMNVVGGGFGSNTTEPYFKNDMAGLLGLGSLGIGALALSDRRLKSNIVRVGTHPLGIGIYDYEIDGQKQRGVMADEVEKVRPGAVVEIGGIKSVNYAAL